MNMNSVADDFYIGYEKLQTRFDNLIVVVEDKPDQTAFVDAEDYANQEIFGGFVDISMPVKDLGPLVGRVLLTPGKFNGVDSFCPVVLTRVSGKLQITRMNQPFDPEFGITEGIMFGLALKQDTSASSFGSHVKAGGYEAGHFAPVLIGAANDVIGESIKQNGDQATHQIGKKAGGVAEQMIVDGLLPGISLKTVELDMKNPDPIRLFWHPKLESEDGLIVPKYENSVNLMLGAAANSLGSFALDKVGGLVNDAVRGSH